MARLQDFSDVTPSSSSDKLLIVQSAGQGLATLDTAGQQIANNTSVSQLNTTRKTLAGAINEHDSEIGTLSSLTTTDKSSLVGAVNSIYPTKDIGGTAKGVGGTYQIPAGVLNHSIITIALRRYAYAGEVTILAENITAGAYTNGLIVYSGENKFATFSISSTGLITITKITNWDNVYIDLIGIF